jgi:hypothetical protein
VNGGFLRSVLRQHNTQHLSCGMRGPRPNLTPKAERTLAFAHGLGRTASFVLCPLFVVCSLMDREKLKRQLEEAEENVAHGVRLVVEQRTRGGS